MMMDIRRNQGRLQEAHERSKMVTRSEEMKKLREQMQVGRRAAWGRHQQPPGRWRRLMV
jgi:hypothetical protein